MGLNWFIPALVNSSVGSSCGTTGLLGTKRWPCFCTKKSMNCCRMSAEEVMNARVKVPDYSRTLRCVQGVVVFIVVQASRLPSLTEKDDGRLDRNEFQKSR